jgi:ERCC4-type nuclease
MEVEIWVDQRERLIIDCFVAADKKCKYKVELKTLSAGDYAIVYKNWILILIERKTWADLTATFLDPKRKFNYMKMLEEREKFNCKVLYLIEGTKPKNNRIPTNTLITHLDHLLFDHDIATVYSTSKEDTINRILQLTHSMITSKNNPILKIDMGIEDEKKGGADESLTTPKVENEDAVIIKMWHAIRGISYLSSDILRNKFSLSKLIKGEYVLSDFKDIRYQSGNKMSNIQIQKILDSAIDVDTHKKILQCIKGCSKDICDLIYKNTNLIEMINYKNIKENQVFWNTLSDIKRESKRRIGGVLIEKINYFLQMI